MSERAVASTERTGRNDVIIPSIEILDGDEHKTACDGAFVWFRRLMAENLHESWPEPGSDGLIVIPGAEDRQTVIVSRSIVGERRRVERRETGDWAQVGPREVYTVAMVGDHGVEPAEVMIVSRQNVQQHGRINGYPLADPETTVDVYGDQGWSRVTGIQLESISWPHTDDAGRSELAAQGELVRTSVEEFAAYLG
jgi:hypothetical protein